MCQGFRTQGQWVSRQWQRVWTGKGSPKAASQRCCPVWRARREALTQESPTEHHPPKGPRNGDTKAPSHEEEGIITTRAACSWK